MQTHSIAYIAYIVKLGSYYRRQTLWSARAYMERRIVVIAVLYFVSN